MLSCECDFYDYEEWYLTTKDFSTLKTKRSRRCCSCGTKIRPGEEVVEFERYRAPRDEIEIRIHGEEGEIELASYYMCEECGGLYLALDERGYCISITDDMRELAKEAGRRDLGLYE